LWLWLTAIAAIWAWPFVLSGDDDAAGAGPRAGASPVHAIASRIKLDLNKPAPGRVEPANPPTTPDSDPAPPARKKEDSSDPKTPGDPRDTASKKTRPPAKSAKPGDKGRVQALEAEAQQCKVADEALLLYRIFMSDPDTTDEEKEEARPRLEYWEQAVKDELVRSGKKWIPKAEADKLREEADKLVKEAIELLDMQSYRKADEKLEKASRICPTIWSRCSCWGWARCSPATLRGPRSGSRNA